MARLVNLGGTLCVDVPANIFGTPLLGVDAKYDVTVMGATIVATFAYGGARAFVPFGLAASSTGATKIQTSHFGVNVDAEAKQFGWQAGRQVTIAANNQSLTFS